jgi:hypothetical protein
MFLDKFSTLTESYMFYNDTEELKYNVEEHRYYRVDPDLGNLTELYGVTNILKIIDRSAALTPWAAKMAIEKLLRTIPVVQDVNGVSWLAPIDLVAFTKIALEAKSAHKDKLEDAGNIGHIAHKCLEDSIQHALDNTEDKIVRELKNVPEDEKAKACAMAGFSWMLTHNVRWIKTEQKIYSREYGYAGTMDGKALVDSCDDPSCCSEQFKDSLSIIDWKSSNALHLEYILQVAGAYRHAEQEEHGEDIRNCFVLRLGKNDEEAGKFEPWRIAAKDFPIALAGFLACLNLVKLVDSVKDLISLQKKGVKEAKKQQKAVQKELDKAAAKAKRETEKAKLKLEHAEEKARIKADAKKAREEAKHGAELVVETGRARRVVVVRPEPINEIPGKAEDTETAALVTEDVVEIPETTPSVPSVPIPALIQRDEELCGAAPVKVVAGLYEEETVERKPFVILEEG